MKRIAKHVYRTNNRFVRFAASTLIGGQIFDMFYDEMGKGNWGDGSARFVLSFDVDYKKDVHAIPHVLSVLDSYGLKASFACVGRWVETFPEEHKRIVEEGHEVLNHTHTHPNSDELTHERLYELSHSQRVMEILKCHKAIKRVLGVTPSGFRTPHFGNQHAEEIYELIRPLEYDYSSSTIAIRTATHGIPYDAGGILEIPVSVCPAHPFNVFDSYHSFRARKAHSGAGEFYGLFEQLVRKVTARCGLVCVYFDPQDVAAYSKEFERALELASHMKKSLVARTLAELAKEIKNAGKPSGGKNDGGKARLPPSRKKKS
jgi:peptidoglycan-N-acetylglucosamine deacetylase